MSEHIIKGRVFVVGDNIDTDQIIPAHHLNLVPTIPEEYTKLGAFAMSGLPDEHKIRYVAHDSEKTDFAIIIARKNFGCGSSREHAPISLGAAGCHAVIANSFARIFFRNCVSTGEVYPIETDEDLTQNIETGDEAEIDMTKMTVSFTKTGETHQLKDLGDVKEVVEAGGIFNYARQAGMIK